MGYWPEFASFFLGGSCAYLWRDRLTRSPLIAAICAFAIVVPITLGRFSVFLAAFSSAGTYLILWIAYHPRIRLDWVRAFGDLSYGTYLYAFLIQQCLVRALPGLSPWSMFLLATPFSLLAGLVSWHLVEKHFLAPQRLQRLADHGVSPEVPNEIVATRASTG